MSIVKERLFGRSAVGPQLLERDGGERLEVVRQPGEGGRALEAALVHIKRAVELQLDGVQAGGRIAVVLGDEAPRIRLVAAYRIALRAQWGLDRLGDRRD